MLHWKQNTVADAILYKCCCFNVSFNLTILKVNIIPSLQVSQAILDKALKISELVLDCLKEEFPT